MSREKTPEKRQRILAAALKVFAQRGFFNAKVSEVAREAQVADGTIYLYFKNKDDLLINLFEDRMEFLIRRLHEEMEREGGSALGRIRRMILAHLRIAEEWPDLAEFITVELRQSAKFVKEYENPKFMEYLKVLRDLIEEGQRDGSVRADLDARAVARAMFGALDEQLLALTLTGRARAQEVPRAAEQLGDLFCAGIQPR
ncbi:MAG: TetR/AcrR family transcriptional regulator [Myxococcales bacterium]|nr:TetR/AcrR family transcriptional regulator [Myxococcales bacterium]MCB9519758.1 TetR/AcrR family transcriptional regulator [Myxococcales bacterium]MCB9530450.1 TetR/AcrR family transcriptional regulator [Myxococcales bacterium]